MLPQAFVVAVALLTIACSGRPAPEPPASPTFTRDIAPIVYQQCATCHRPGQAGPFSLLTYSDVRRRARLIAEVTRSRYMPPWKPEAGHGEFVGERRLTDVQIATIQRWVEGNAPEGDPRDLPPPPSFPGDWQLGAPDLVVTMPAPLEVPAEGVDVFRTTIVPLTIGGPKYVRAVEFRPGNPAAVHHAMVRLARGAAARTIEGEGMLATEEEIASPDGHVLGWAPGYSPAVMPDGMAWRLEPGVALAIELHLQTTGKPERVQSSVGLFFADRPPSRTPFGVQLGSYAIDIPPGEPNYVVEDQYEMPVDVTLHAVYPHAHYLGKDIRAYAVLPDGTERSLVWIRDWDFKWQNAYRYRTPMTLPRGTVVKMRYTYDNSAANPRNPSKPPRRVRYGGQSTDEMGNLWMQVVPAEPRQLDTLRTHYQRKGAERELAGFELLARDQPRNGAVLRALGATYLRLGRVDEAIPALRRAVRLAPGDATAHYNLGHALAATGQAGEAAASFRRAARLQPSFAEAHNNLGAVLLRRGDTRGALEALESAIRIDPDHAEAHLNLGLTHHRRGDRPAATRHLRRAIELRPSESTAYNALAWLLATAPDVTPASAAEAVTLAERAASLTGGRDASVLDTLAAAFAASGDRPRAAAAAERAAQVALSNGQRELAEEIRRRAHRYRAAGPLPAKP